MYLVMKCEHRFLICESTIKSIFYKPHTALPAKTGRSPNAGTMLTHRLRRWPNIETTLGERVNSWVTAFV